jgi:hypothetical protein
MSDNDFKFAKLMEWQQAMESAEAAKVMVAREQALRKEVVEMFFPTPVEGTNNFELAAGYKLKLTYKLDRKLDDAALPAVMQKVRDLGINTDELLSFKPSLDTKAYRVFTQLHPEASKVFDEALTVKPGSPVLELVAPKS